jgi:hypothetical protein
MVFTNAYGSYRGMIYDVDPVRSGIVLDWEEEDVEWWRGHEV